MSSSHQSKFPCIIITIIIILLFFSSFSTLLTVNLFVLFWRCFVMLNSYFVCFIIYIFFFNFEIFFVDIIFVPKIGVCFSFYPVSLIFEYEAKPHIRWPNMRLANLVPTSRRLRFLARKAEWSGRGDFTSVLFSRSSGYGPSNTAAYLWFGWMIRRTPRVHRSGIVRAPYGNLQCFSGVVFGRTGPCGRLTAPARAAHGLYI